MEGLSVIICCHNGASRLPVTLGHLKMQELPRAPWEVLIIDNLSTDNSAEVARSCWREGPVPLRVINESRLGVRYARERGFIEARYGFLGFVDDDNWLAHDWVRAAYEVISADTDLGAVGSIRTPACEKPAPRWFEDFHEAYAVLTDDDLHELAMPLTYLPTAGLCLRRASWERLVRNGFRFQLTGTVGNNLQGGEDSELTMALRLSGWKLKIDPRLRLQHFMPSERLQWTYLRRLLRKYGASHVPLDAYVEHSLSLSPVARRWISENWCYQLAKSLRQLARRPRSVVAALSSDCEGRVDVVEVEQLFGRTLGLLRLRGRYGALRREVRDASWRHPQNSGLGASGTSNNVVSTI
jgi:glycosyltransferase involved in cell wall biosynthesis